MSKFASPYYPPRARWYNLVFTLGNSIRRHLALDRIRLPRGVTLPGLVGSFLIPGLGFYLRGPRLWGRIAVSACGFLFLGFIMWLGYPMGNLAFGLMLSVHVTGFVYYCSPLLVDMDFAPRMLLTIGVLVAIGGFVYVPARSAIQGHWLIPLRLQERVFVVQKQTSPRLITRGDWVAYHLPGYIISVHGDRWGEHTGMGFGPVLAIGGDRVEFSTNHFAVNDIAHPLLPHMPESGSITVPENHWFIWPDFVINGHGNVGEANISAAMLERADVPEDQFVGKPFKRWFWRQQTLP